MASPSVMDPIFRYDSGERLHITRAFIDRLAETPSECEIGAVEQAIARLDYQDAFARILARAVNRSPIPAELMAALFPWCRLPDGVGLVALSEGDRGMRLVELSERGRFPHDFEGAALRGLGLHAAWILEGEGLRARITKELHRIRARYKAPRGYYYAAIAGELARVLGEDSLARDYDTVLPEDVLDLREALSTTHESVLRTMLKELEPEGSPRRVEGLRQAIVHAAPKVGRNEPCPCGSGQKYKRCHGNTAHDVPLTPSTLTVDDIIAMPYERVCMLEPEALADLPLQALLSRFVAAKAQPRAEQVLELVAARPGVPPEHIDHYRARMIEDAMPRFRHDFIQRHIGKLINAERVGLDPLARLGLSLRLRSPDVGDGLLAAASDVVQDDTGRLAAMLAAHLLFVAPPLGILIGRGCLLADDELVEVLLSMTEEARAQLGLPSNDLAVRIHAGLQHEREARDARMEAEGLRAALQEATRRNRELEQRGRGLEAQLRERDAAASIQRESNTTSDFADARALREKIELLQERIREGNQERAALRRQLAATGSDADDGERAQSSGSVAPMPDDEEETVAADLAPRRIMVPCWSRQAEDGLRAVPAHVAAEALRTVADLAGGDVAAWRAVKRPKRVDRAVLMVRIGIHHRLIFEDEGDRLDVLELIPRSGLDVAIKRLRAT